MQDAAMREVPLIVGQPAPAFVLHDASGHPTLSPRGVPWMLVFARRWSPDREPELLAVRAQLRGLGARLIVVTETGAWSFEPRGDGARFSPMTSKLEADLAQLAARYGVSPGTDAAFLVDEAGLVRFTQVPPMRLAVNLPVALGAAVAAVMQPRRQATRAIAGALQRAAAAA